MNNKLSNIYTLNGDTMDTNKEVQKIAKQILSIANEISDSNSFDENIYFCDYIINLTKSLERTAQFKQNEAFINKNEKEVCTLF